MGSSGLWSWVISSDGAGVVGLSGLMLGLIGFGLTVLGLRLTFLQAQDAKRSADAATSAADAAGQAVESFKFRLDRYAAYRDLSEAEFAINACKDHLQTKSWSHASESYDVARKALIRVQHTEGSLSDDIRDRIRQMIEHMTSFCNKVDAAAAGKGAYPDVAKVIGGIRADYEVLSAAKVALEKDIVL